MIAKPAIADNGRFFSSQLNCTQDKTSALLIHLEGQRAFVSIKYSFANEMRQGLE